jgi:tRNA-Thr(GGU) m(6)t(6)A37 methyltransferase TsaA
MNQTINYIGAVRSTLKNLKDCPLQESENAPEAILDIFPEFKEGISDIKEETELIIFSWLHLADRTILNTKPRNEANAKLTGVFSTRSPDRPSPIGMHIVKVISVDGCYIRLSQLDVLDGTPVIDIKPVITYEVST